jgi:hypothetical protein
VRTKHLIPLVLLGLFATGLLLGVALLQKAKKDANQDYLADEVETEGIRNEIIDDYLLGDTKDRDALFAKRMKNNESRREQAVKRQDEAFAAAYMWQSYIIWAGIASFVIFVAVILYTARKSADRPSS